MNTSQDVVDFVRNGHLHYLPHLSIDCVIFGYHANQLKTLLLRYHGHEQWSLPGGFVRRHEPLSEAAHRILATQTQIADLFLQQFHTFGDGSTRLNRIETQQIHNRIFAKAGVAIAEDHWLSERTLSVGYYALVDYLSVTITPDFLVEEYAWCDVDAIPSLLFDHQEIIEKALLTLRDQLYQQPIGARLLPAKFTLPEIHALYETILGKPFDRRNFRKKLLALGLVRQLPEQRRIGAHRSPYLYEFDPENYHRALEEGSVLAG